MLAGRVSPEQAAVIVDAVDKLPLDAGVRERGEAVLLDESDPVERDRSGQGGAGTWSRSPTRSKAERKAEKDLDRADRAAHHGRFLSIVEDGAGGVRLRGRGTVEDAAVLKAALLPLTKPQPATGPGRPARTSTDPRDHGARLWDALVEVAQHALASDLPPDCHGARPRVAVTTSPRRAPAARSTGPPWGPRRR